MKEGDTETPKAETPADTELADQTLTAAVYTDASMATPDESAAATITVSGSMPKDAYVKAYPVEVAIDEVNVLAAFDITVYAADGTVFEPAEDAPLSVKIDAPTVNVLVTAPSQTTVDSGNTTRTKTVNTANAKTSDGDDIYNLALTFQGKKLDITPHSPVDIVFVLDVSGSMNETVYTIDEANGTYFKYQGNYYNISKHSNYEHYWDGHKYSASTRLDAAKEAINTFVTSAATNQLDARYSLVTFSGLKSYNGYYDGPKYVPGYTDSDYNDATIIQGWGSTVDLSGVTAAGGTNYEAGLMLAKQLVQNDRSSAAKMVIFLSDGQPTFRYDDSGYTVGLGNNYQVSNLTNANTQIAAIAGNAGYFYAIGCDMPSSFPIYDEYGHSTQKTTSGSDILTAMVDKFKAVNTAGVGAALPTTSDKLSTVFSGIVNHATSITCKDVSIVDALSDNIEIYNTTTNSIYDLSTDTNLDTLKSLVTVKKTETPTTGSAAPPQQCPTAIILLAIPTEF
jgi:hypothetical protein